MESLLLQEARRHFPAIKARTFYTLNPNGARAKKKTITTGQLVALLVTRKIKTVERWALKQPGVTRTRWSNTTNSFYFDLNGITFRLSDHGANGSNFQGISYIVAYSADPLEIIFNIIAESYKPDL